MAHAAAVPTVAPAPASASIAWRVNALPVSGELVLTDVHAAWDGVSGRVHAMAVAEGGLVLRSDAPAAASAPNWTVALDAGFPHYFYGVYVFNATNALVTGFIGELPSGGIVALLCV